MPMTKEKYDEFVRNLEEVLDGIAAVSSKNYDMRTSSGMDLILVPTPDSTTVAEMVKDAFKPAAHNTRTRYWTIIEFKVQDVEPTHPILTREGIEAAHHQMFDKLRGYVVDESGRLGKCLDSVSAELGKTKEEIREIIATKLDDFKHAFESNPSYPEKNKILVSMRELYQDVRNHEKLSSLVQENSPQYRP